MTGSLRRVDIRGRGGRTLGEKRGCVAGGRTVWRLKDWIDRRFMRRFQVLDAAGAPASGFPSPESMGMEPMDCGGCAAKLGASSLDAALARRGPPPADESVLVGRARPDDAAALAEHRQTAHFLNYWNQMQELGDNVERRAQQYTQVN